MSRQEREAQQAKVAAWAQPDAEQDYRIWWAAIDHLVRRKMGFGLLDLPDYQFRAAYDSGMTPSEVAEEIIELGI